MEVTTVNRMFMTTNAHKKTHNATVYFETLFFPLFFHVVKLTTPIKTLKMYRINHHLIALYRNHHQRMINKHQIRHNYSSRTLYICKISNCRIYPIEYKPRDIHYKVIQWKSFNTVLDSLLAFSLEKKRSGGCLIRFYDVYLFNL